MQIKVDGVGRSVFANFMQTYLMDGPYILLPYEAKTAPFLFS